MTLEAWAVVVSWVAAAISAYAAFRSKQSKDEANAISKRLLDIEEDREHDRRNHALRAKLIIDVNAPDPKNHFFIPVVIENLGPADAADVYLKVQPFLHRGRPESVADGVVVSGNTKMKLLPAGSKNRLYLSCSADFDRIELQLFWVDELGAKQLPPQTLD